MDKESIAKRYDNPVETEGSSEPNIKIEYKYPKIMAIFLMATLFCLFVIGAVTLILVTDNKKNLDNKLNYDYKELYEKIKVQNEFFHYVGYKLILQYELNARNMKFTADENYDNLTVKKMTDEQLFISLKMCELKIDSTWAVMLVKYSKDLKKGTPEYYNYEIEKRINYFQKWLYDENKILSLIDSNKTD